MKNVVLLQKSHAGTRIDMTTIFYPEKFQLILIINEYGYQKLLTAEQTQFFKKIFITDDFSFENISILIASVAKPDNIVTNAEELMPVCGALRVSYGIDTQDYTRFLDKSVMKHKLLGKVDFPRFVTFNKAHYVESPEAYVDYLVNQLRFPLFIKPLSMYACVGAMQIRDINQLRVHLGTICHDPIEYEIDEYIAGTLYHCDSYIKNGQLLYTQVSECSRPCYDFMLGETKGSIVLQTEDAIYQKLVPYTEQILTSIGMPQGGVMHTEIFKEHATNKLYFLEVAHRSPGILIPDMYKKYLNVGTMEPHILLQIHEEYMPPFNKGPYAAWVSFAKRPGKVTTLFSPQIKSEHEIHWQIQPGDSLTYPSTGRDYAGTVLLWNNDYTQLKQDFTYLNYFNAYTVKKDPVC